MNTYVQSKAAVNKKKALLKRFPLFGALGIFAIVFLFCFDTVHV